MPSVDVSASRAVPSVDVTLAVIADTHSRPHARALERVAAMAPTAILHAGDVGDPACLAPFAKVAPLYVVRGNIDGTDWPDVRVIEFQDTGRRLLRLLLTHIAVDKLKPSRAALAAAAEHEVDLIVCGHSHVPFVTSAPCVDQREVVLFNPGSVGPKRFHLPIVLGRLELQDTGRLVARHLDVETGEDWRPI